MTTNTPSVLPASGLHVGKYNPRGHIEKDATWDSFVESIKAHNGVYTPIVVRAVENGPTPWEIVCGQRRFYGALEAYGTDYLMPVNVKVLTDAEAEAMALSENIDRADMNPVEEAEGAARVLADSNGDRKEACRRLGWKEAFLNDRLKLMACSATVRKAIVTKTITLGLGELLAGMTYEEQDEQLAEFIKNGVPTAEEAKAIIMAKTKSLSIAIFNKDACATCTHNSATQQALFGAVEAGHCMNAKCYDQKTEDVLQAKIVELKDTYQRVQIYRAGDNMTVFKVDADKLGATQAEACRSCADHGAIISGTANKLGTVLSGICFGVQCNREKTEAYAKEQADAQAALAAEQAEAEAAEQANAASGKAGAEKPASTKAKPEKAKPPVTSTKAPTVVLGNAIHEYRDKLYRGVLLREYAANNALSAQFVMAIVMNNQGRYFDGMAFTGALENAKVISKKSVHSLGDAMKAATNVSTEVATQIVTRMGTTAIDSLTRTELCDLVALSGADLGTYFKLNDESGANLLKVLTTEQIGIVCDELGITAAMGPKAYKTATSGKKDRFIEMVTSVEGFDYTGKVPKMLNPKFSK